MSKNIDLSVLDYRGESPEYIKCKQIMYFGSFNYKGRSMNKKNYSFRPYKINFKELNFGICYVIRVLLFALQIIDSEF